MKTIFILIIIVLLSSCVTQKKCLQKFPPTETRDSSYVEKITMKPVAMPGFSHNLQVPVINCPDQLLADVENSKLKQQIQILNGKLISNTIIKPDTVFVPQVETHTIINEVKVPQPVKIIPPFYKKCMYFTVLVITLILLYAGFKIKKIFSLLFAKYLPMTFLR